MFVDEPTVIQAIEILRGLRDTYEAHHKVRISDEAVVAAAELSDRYITNRFLPDKAIDLLDQAAARIRIRSKSRPPDLQELEATIGTRRREMDYLSSRSASTRPRPSRRRSKRWRAVSKPAPTSGGPRSALARPRSPPRT